MSGRDDLIYHLLRLERQLESYQKLHQEELDELRAALRELKEKLLMEMPTEESTESSSKEGRVGPRLP